MSYKTSLFLFLAVVLAAVVVSQILNPGMFLHADQSSLTANEAAQANQAASATNLFPSSTAISANNPVANAGSAADPGAAVVATAPGVPQLPIAATLVADLGTGKIYESSNPDRRWAMASLTKLMTATIVEDEIDPTAKITVSPQAYAMDPNEISLAMGGTYSVNDLLHALLMPSSNVAAESFANYYGRDQFIAAMNARAAAWGMKSTYFDDPSGISAANQSTASDLMILAKQVYEHYPQILAVTKTAEFTITDLATGAKVKLKSINSFAGEEDFIGGKTGHTEQADGNLLSIFSHEGHPILVIVLGTNSRFPDTEKLYDWFKTNYVHL